MEKKFNENKAKNTVIALAMASIFNAVIGKFFS